MQRLRCLGRNANESKVAEFEIKESLDNLTTYAMVVISSCPQSLRRVCGLQLLLHGRVDPAADFRVRGKG